MTNTQINQIIHEARGLCWHMIKYRKDEITMPRFRCSKCPDRYPQNNPDYTSDWSNWGEALEWAQRQKWWADFAYEMRPASPVHTILNAFMREDLLSPSEGSTALAGFIVKHPEYFKKEVEK